METPLAEELKPGDLEGLVLDKFLVDAFKPKLCDEKDIAVVTFLVKQKDPAQDLSGYIAQGNFDLLDVEASSAPDEDGYYNLLVEMNRNPEMFDIMDHLLQHITQLVNVKEWQFKPYDYGEYLAWTKENFLSTVPHNVEAYLSDQSELLDESESAASLAGTQASEFNYQLLGKVIEEQITKSSRTYVKAFQKQFKIIIKDNRRLLQHIENLKSDHQYLHQQLELYEQREKMALLREQQDFKRIRALEHQVSLLAPYDPEHPEIVIPKPSDPITIERNDMADTPREPPAAKDTISRPEQPEGSGGSAEESVGETPAPSDKESRDSGPGLTDKTPTEDGKQAIVWDLDTFDGDTTQGEITIDAKSKADIAKSSTETDLSANKPSDDDPSASTRADAPGTSDSARRLIAQGLESIKKKDYYTAIEYFTQVTQQVPNARRSLLRIAILYYRLKDYDAARDHALKALDLGAESAKRILAKIEEKQAADIDTADTEEFSETPTEEAIIWGADDFIENATASEISMAQGKSQADTDAQQDVMIYGEPAEETQYADRRPEPLDRGDSSPAPVDEPSTETVVMDFEALGSLEPPVPSTAEPQTAPDPETAKIYFSRGLKAFEQKNYHKAIECFTKVTELLPNARRSFIRLAALYYRLKDYDTAKAHAQKALDLGSASAKRILEKIDVKQKLGFDASADTEFADTVSDIPTGDDVATPKTQSVGKSSLPGTDAASSAKGVEAKTYFTRGVEAFEQKNYQQAIENFTRVTELLPKAPRSFLRLAVLHYRLKDYENAREFARQALELGSDSAQRILEKIEVKQSTASDALAPAKVTDTLPEFPSLDIEESDHPAAGAVDPSSEGQDVRVSESPFEKAPHMDQQPPDQKDSQDSEPLSMESATETISLDADNLMSAFASESSPADAEPFPKADPVSDYFALGLAAAEQESYHKAIENFTKVTELLPDAPASYLNLANLYLKLKNFERAKENADRAYELGSESAKRILEKLEAQRWTDSAISQAGSAESVENGYATTDG
ncbi:MAG: tetratricopeptide repeat protein [Desulfobacterales bacterium]|jgi:tetratricopeptide (TPR) repeat protein